MSKSHDTRFAGGLDQQGQEFEKAQRLIDHWGGDAKSVIRRAVCDVLLRDGNFHSNDLQALDLPQALERPDIASAVAWLVNKKWITKVGACPNRHGAMVGIYQLTEHGRWELGDDSATPNRDYAINGSGCWVWQRNLNRGGYGLMRDEGAMRSAHRVFYERAKGRVPEGLQLDHLCRNRACVNPAHLEPVTAAENQRRAPRTKLNWEKAREIRASTGRCRDVAAEYGVTAMAVSKIRRNLSWKIEEDPALSTVSGGHIPPGRVKRDTVSIETPAVSVSPKSAPAAKERVDTPAELTGGRDRAGEAQSSTSHSGSTSPALSLFDLAPDRAGYYDREAA